MDSGYFKRSKGITKIHLILNTETIDIEYHAPEEIRSIREHFLTQLICRKNPPVSSYPAQLTTNTKSIWLKETPLYSHNSIRNPLNMSINRSSCVTHLNGTTMRFDADNNLQGVIWCIDTNFRNSQPNHRIFFYSPRTSWIGFFAQRNGKEVRY